MVQHFENIFQEGLFVTGVGLFVVFTVLVLLTFVVYMFRFIPEENNIRSVEKSSLPMASLQSDVKLSPVHQALIIACILEDIAVSSSKNFVKINKIKQLETQVPEEGL